MRILLCMVVCCCLPLLGKAQTQSADTAQAGNLNQYLFKTLEGKDFRFSDLKGNCVYVEIWAMGCKPCLMELNHARTLMEKNRNRPLKFVSVCVENNTEAWKKFVNQRQLVGIQLVTPIMSPFLKENGFIGVPRCILLDKNGNIAVRKAKLPSDPGIQEQLEQWCSH